MLHQHIAQVNRDGDVIVQGGRLLLKQEGAVRPHQNGVDVVLELLGEGLHDVRLGHKIALDQEQSLGLFVGILEAILDPVRLHRA